MHQTYFGHFPVTKGIFMDKHVDDTDVRFFDTLRGDFTYIKGNLEELFLFKTEY